LAPHCSDAIDLHPNGFVLTYNRLYKGFPCGSRRGAPPKHRNTKQELGRSKIWGETPVRHCRCDLHHLQRLYLHHRDEEGVVHLWTMGLWH
jgi:hypothetical protein